MRLRSLLRRRRGLQSLRDRFCPLRQAAQPGDGLARDVGGLIDPLSDGL